MKPKHEFREKDCVQYRDYSYRIAAWDAAQVYLKPVYHEAASQKVALSSAPRGVSRAVFLAEAVLYLPVRLSSSPLDTTEMVRVKPEAPLAIVIAVSPLRDLCRIEYSHGHTTEVLVEDLLRAVTPLWPTDRNVTPTTSLREAVQKAQRYLKI